MPDLNFAGDRVEDDTAHGPPTLPVLTSILVAAVIIPAEKRKVYLVLNQLKSRPKFMVPLLSVLQVHGPLLAGIVIRSGVGVPCQPKSNKSRKPNMLRGVVKHAGKDFPRGCQSLLCFGCTRSPT